jgi:hypothetical protein
VTGKANRHERGKQRPADEENERPERSGKENKDEEKNPLEKKKNAPRRNRP